MLRHPPFDLSSLLLGVYLGMVGNLVTGAPSRWWWPFSLLPSVAGQLLVLSLAVVVALWLVSWWRDRRVRFWRSKESPYAGLSAYEADRASVFFGRDGEIAAVLRKVRKPSGRVGDYIDAGSGLGADFGS